MNKQPKGYLHRKKKEIGDIIKICADRAFNRHIIILPSTWDINIGDYVYIYKTDDIIYLNREYRDFSIRKKAMKHNSNIKILISRDVAKCFDTTPYYRLLAQRGGFMLVPIKLDDST